MNISVLGRAITDRRKSLGINQRDLARIAGISVHALSDIESGKGNPTVDTLTRIIEPLGLEFRLLVKAQG